MFRTYYALAKGLVKPDGFTVSVTEVADPPSHFLEEALIAGDVDVANLYLPNFLRRKIEGAPIMGIATEWKSTAKGNGMFVLADGAIKRPEELAGRLIGSHQGAHARHRFILKRCFDVDDGSLRWESCPQEGLLETLKRGAVDAVILLDQFFFHGEKDPKVRCLYTDGQMWEKLLGFHEIIKHMIAVRGALLEEHPDLRQNLIKAFQASFAYSEQHLDEIATEFMRKYGGERDSLIASARYPRIEFTLTETERSLVEAEMDMMLEVGEISRRLPLSSMFVV
jgi:ABC-type nitrate/sulfonate/bicarbonate transport system substrate-binding protein